MHTIYQLKHNQRFIDQVQKATQTTKEFGIEPTYGLFGSEECGRNILDGTLRVDDEIANSA